MLAGSGTGTEPFFREFSIRIDSRQNAIPVYVFKGAATPFNSTRTQKAATSRGLGGRE
jgi:hypothetical protein